MSYDLSMPVQLSKERRKERICPNCGKKEFTPYLYTDSLAPVNEAHVGKCNREVHCGYHYTPKMYKSDGGELGVSSYVPPAIIPKEMLLIPSYLIAPSLALDKIDVNNYAKWLFSYFQSSHVADVLHRYKVGTGRDNATIYWQMDVQGDARTGKIMKYDAATGKRDKTHGDAINWVHNRLEKAGELDMSDYELRQVFFGSHLIYDHKGVIHICESESTAVFMAIRNRGELWLATGGSNGGGGFRNDNASALHGRDVILHPDKGYLDKWVEAISRENFARYTKTLTFDDTIEKCEWLNKNDDLRDYYTKGNGR